MNSLGFVSFSIEVFTPALENILEHYPFTQREVWLPFNVYWEIDFIYVRAIIKVELMFAFKIILNHENIPVL